MTLTPPFLDQLRDDLVAGIQTFERHRTRTRRVWGSAAIVLLGVAIAAGIVSSRDGGGKRVTSTPSTSVGSTATTSGVRPEPFSARGVPAMLFATNGNGRDVAVTDLSSGAMAVYDEIHHSFGNGAISGVVFTADDQLVVWQTGRRAVVYSTARSAGGASPLVEQAELSTAGRELGTITGDRQIVATDAGNRVWIRASGRANEEARIELVDLRSGAVQMATTIPTGSLPGGSTLFDALGDDAIVIDNWREPNELVLRISATGQTTVVEPPEPGASLVTATPTHTAWIASGNRLVIVGDHGDTNIVAALGPGEWALTGWPTIPSSGPRLRTVSADGSRALLALVDPGETVPNRLALVDLRTATATVLDHSDGTPVSPRTAFWAQDDNTIVVIEGPNTRQIVTTINQSERTTTTLDDAIPAEFFVIAGG